MPKAILRAPSAQQQVTAALVVLAAAGPPASAQVRGRVLAERGASRLEKQAGVVPVQIPQGISFEDFRTANQLVLTIEGIIAEDPGVYYEIYMNMPATARPNYRNPHYVGNLTLFGLTEEELARMGPHGHGGASEAFDVTAVVRTARAQSQWFEDRIELTFVPVGAEHVPQSQAVATLGRLLVTRTE